MTAQGMSKYEVSVESESSFRPIQSSRVVSHVDSGKLVASYRDFCHPAEVAEAAAKHYVEVGAEYEWVDSDPLLVYVRTDDEAWCFKVSVTSTISYDVEEMEEG